MLEDESVLPVGDGAEAVVVPLVVPFAIVDVGVDAGVVAAVLVAPGPSVV